MLNRKTISGSGAAHIGFSMFGARGPLLGPEDGGNGAGGSNPNPPPAPPAAPAEQPAAPQITPEVRALIEAESKKAKDAAFAEARRLFEGKNRNEPKPPNGKNETNNADDPSSLLALRDAFDDATSELKLTKGQRQILREGVMRERPGDVESFVSTFVERAGWTPAGPPPSGGQEQQMKNQQGNGTPPPAGQRPISNNGSPAGTPAERSDDILKWTEEDIERHYRSKGGIVRRGDDGTLDLSVAANAKIHRELREMARQRLANTRVLLGRQRRA